MTLDDARLEGRLAGIKQARIIAHGVYDITAGDATALYQAILDALLRAEMEIEKGMKDRGGQRI